MRKTLQIAILICLFLYPFSAVVNAKQSINSLEPIMVQDEEYVPYDEWYEPDGANETDDGSPTDGRDMPEVPNNNSREAPKEDTRPNSR